MLVLSRKKTEQITIGNDITIKVMEISTGRVRIGIDAPKGVKILRTELAESQGDEAIVESIGETEPRIGLLKV